MSEQSITTHLRYYLIRIAFTLRNYAYLFNFLINDSHSCTTSANLDYTMDCILLPDACQINKVYFYASSCILCHSLSLHPFKVDNLHSFFILSKFSPFLFCRHLSNSDSFPNCLNTLIFKCFRTALHLSLYFYYVYLTFVGLLFILISVPSIFANICNCKSFSTGLNN